MKTLVKMNFNPDIAKEVGTDAAIIFENIVYWIDKNYQNQKNKNNKTSFFENRWWTYNSIDAFQGQFVWLTERQIDLRLKLLEEKDYIRTGNYNKNKYDRTTWYAVGDNPLTEDVKSISRNGEMEVTQVLNGSHTSVKPIPNGNTNVSSSSKKTTTDCNFLDIKTVPQEILHQRVAEIIRDCKVNTAYIKFEYEKYISKAKKVSLEGFKGWISNDKNKTEEDKPTLKNLHNYGIISNEEYGDRLLKEAQGEWS